MNRPELASFDGRRFDVAVIGAGVNGASAAQHLAARGYDVLLVDKSDFASGASGRSSRLLHCGLRYLAPGASMWEFARHPSRLATALRMARQAMACRAQFAQATPERVRPITLAFPFYRDGPYKAWQIDLAFRVLDRLGGGKVPLDYRPLSAKDALAAPLTGALRDPDRLLGAATFREYQFDWPERIVVETALDAERLGATVRNHTAVTRLERGEDGWRLHLVDALDAENAPATVEAGLVFNMAGFWIDRVGGSIAGQRPGRRVTGTKGAHIVVRLPPECADLGVITLNRLNLPFYCIPWRGLHYFGPTETLYEGDPDDIRPSEEDVDFLLGEANHLLPGLGGLARADILYGWAGVRPLTYDPDLPDGARSREVHDFADAGQPGLFAMTAGPIMTHRSAGAEIADLVAKKLPAPRAPQAPSFAATPPVDEDSPLILNHGPPVHLSEIRRAARDEHARTLVDALFRRTAAGWSDTMGREAARAAAQAMGEELGWTPERIEQEARDYVAYVERQFLLAGGG